MEEITFFVLAGVAVITALGLLLSRNAVYAALFLVANFAVVAVFFLLLAAPFIAMAQVTVYAGAIMVLFLFVIMLLGAERLPAEDRTLPSQWPLALILGAAFLGLMAAFIGLSLTGPTVLIVPPAFESEAAARAFGEPHAIGLTLFSEFLLPFQITGVLLLAALVGAVFLSRERQKKA